MLQLACARLLATNLSCVACVACASRGGNTCLIIQGMETHSRYLLVIFESPDIFN